VNALFKSLATVVLAAVAPLLVIGTPRGLGTCSDSASFFDELKKCSENEPYTPHLEDPVCNESGKSLCDFAVTYLDKDNHVVTDRVVHSDSYGIITVGGCKMIQRKRCVGCITNVTCP